jgi:polyisoprenoid-binding protein YceI
MKETLLLIMLFISSITAHCQKINVKDAHAEVHGKAPLNKYKGVSDKLKGEIDLNTNSVWFTIPLQSIKTGNSKRDKHMCSALEVKEFPTASFNGTIVSDFDYSKKFPQKVTVKGSFTIHGQTRELTVIATMVPSENGIGLSADWSLSLSDFNIKRPAIGFYKVKDFHKIYINGKGWFKE